jgi:GntR family transcriptional repressor for pyruvate dehydrogenase complex
MLKQPKLSQIIESKLEAMIIDGALKAGQKLPAERELAKQYDVSRPSIREAIQKLEAKKLVVRRQGDGTFVSNNVLVGMPAPFVDLVLTKESGQSDLLEFRLGVEGMSAYYAAIRGTKADFEDLQTKYDNIGLAQIENDYRVEASAVFDFYLSICAASHNTVILHLTNSMSEMLINNIESNLRILAKRPDIFDRISRYRKQLLNAILSGKPQKAWSESHHHLTFIEQVLIQQTQEQSQLESSLRKMRRY